MNYRKKTKLPNPVNYSLWRLNYGSKSEKKMLDALIKRGFSEEIAVETVASLKNWGYIDDERHKEYIIHKRKSNNPKGRSFVYRELRDDGIENLDDLSELYTDEEEQEIIKKLLAQWEKKESLSPENKDKYFLRLARRGFAKSNILLVIERRLGEIEIFS